MKELLIELDACDEAKEWAEDKSWQEIYDTCHRGDWLLWLFFRVNPENKQEFTLAKGHCANTVRHLMKDERSIAAVDAAIAYGDGRINDEELAVFANAALDVALAINYADDPVEMHAAIAAYATNYADDPVEMHAAIAAYGAVILIDDIYNTALYTALAVDKFNAANSDWEENRSTTASICRQYLPIEIWNI